jgi:SAM-dependent methyltransferase
MSHPQQQFFVGGIKQFLPGYFAGKRVLEVGSLNLNGSVREFFADCDYVGLDVGEGRDVDVVCAGEDYGEKSGAFDVVISCEAMEHNVQWRKTWLNMVRLLKDDGLLILTCATAGRRQHGTEQYNPGDSPLSLQKSGNYYQNLTEQDFRSVLVVESWFSVSSFFVDHCAYDLYFFGLGRAAAPEVLEKGRQLRDALTDYYHKRNVLGFQ